MPASPINQYLTLTLRALGFDTFNSNLLSIPTQVWTIFNMLIFTWLVMSPFLHLRFCIFLRFFEADSVIVGTHQPPRVARRRRSSLASALRHRPRRAPLRLEQMVDLRPGHSPSRVPDAAPDAGRLVLAQLQHGADQNRLGSSLQVRMLPLQHVLAAKRRAA